MAFDVTALTAYIEDQDFPLIAQMQAVGGLAESGVNIQTGIKESSHLQFLSTDVVFQADACSRTGADTTTFTQRTITVGAIQINEDLCIKDLNGYWTQTMVQMGARGEEVIPGAIEAVWMEKKMNAVQNQLTISDFQGDTLSATNNLSYYDGLLKLVDADGTVVDGNTGAVTVATGITTSNVLDILDGMWESIPDNISEATDKVLYVPTSVYKKYVIALKNANLFHFNPEQNEERLYGTDVRLVPTVGLPGTAGNERMILMRASNCTIGMDGDSDEDNLDIWYSKDDRVNKMNITFKRGVQYAFGSEIVEFTLVP
jgi:hypothetical protein